jgi:hypothetical protein
VVIEDREVEHGGVHTWIINASIDFVSPVSQRVGLYVSQSAPKIEGVRWMTQGWTLRIICASQYMHEVKGRGYLVWDTYAFREISSSNRDSALGNHTG